MDEADGNREPASSRAVPDPEGVTERTGEEMSAPAAPPGTPGVPPEQRTDHEAGQKTEPARIDPAALQLRDEVEDPVEILVGLAERGEIDPWNINIIEVTDRFLSELERRRQLNLQLSGRTLFYAATLLRMKSEQLEIPGEEEGESDGEDFYGEGFGPGAGDEIDFSGRLGPIERLEHEIQRRLDRKNMRKSPITLFELITELKNIEKEDRRRRRMAAGRADLPDLLIDAEDVVGIAHEEGYQETAMTRLAEYLGGLEIDEEMTLAELCARMEWGIPEVYIPLLFLALDGRCLLRQEEFFGDIFIRICQPEQGEPVAGSVEEPG